MWLTEFLCEWQPRLHRTSASPSHIGSRILAAFEEVWDFPVTGVAGTDRMLLARIWGGIDGDPEAPMRFHKSPRFSSAP